MKTGEAINLNKIINLIKLAPFEISELENLLELKKELKQKAEDYQLLLIDIMKKFNVPSVGGNYNWIGHPKESEITEAMKLLNEKEIELKSLIKCKTLAKDKFKDILTNDINADMALMLHETFIK